MKHILGIILLSLLAFAADYPAQIKQVNGTPTLFIDGKPVYASALRINIEDGSVSKFMFRKGDNAFRQFAEAGTPVFFIGTNAGWHGIDKYDFSYFDRVVEQIAKEAPNAYIIPNIFLYRATWFPTQFPEECFQLFDDKGNMSPKYGCTTFWSKRFETEAKKSMGAFIRHIEEKGYASRIIGYQVSFGGTAEWIWWDTAKKRGDGNPQAVAAWRAYLENKYKNIASLNKAHGTNWSDFDNVGPFKDTFWTDFKGGYIRDLALDRAKADYGNFINLRQAELKRSLCGFVKMLTQGRALVGLYNYFAEPELDGAPEIDFTVSSTIYTDRAEQGIALSQARQLEHLRRTGKLYFHDADLRTCLWRQNPMYSVFNMLDSISIMRREFGAMFVKGAGNAWFSLNPYGNVFDNPEFMRCIAETEALANTAIAKMNYDLSSNAEIAFVFDRYGDTGFWGQYCFNSNFGRLGASVDFFPANRLDLITEQYKLVVFASPPRLKAEDVARLKSNGRTLLFFYASGMNGENGLHVENATAVTGFNYKTLSGIDREIAIEKPYQDVFGERRAVIGKVGGMPANTFRLVVVPDDKTEVIGRAPADGEVLFARKKHDNWTAIYYDQYQMHSDWLQAIARQAGVTVYDDSTETFFYRNKHFWVVSADTVGGDKSLNAPNEKAVLDVFNGKIIPVENGKVVLKEMFPCETRILLSDTPERLEQFCKIYKEELAKRKVTRPPFNTNCVLLPENGSDIYVMAGMKRELPIRIVSDGDYRNVVLTADVSSSWKMQPMEIGDISKYEEKLVKLPLEAVKVGAKDKLKLVLSNADGEIARVDSKNMYSTEYCYLSDLPWVEATTGWGEIQLDKCVMNRELRMGGKSYPKGIGVHATSHIVYDLDAKWSRMTGIVGVDAFQHSGGKGVASVGFTILGDDKVLFKSGTLYGGGKTVDFDIDIRGVKCLVLDVDNAGDGGNRDHADWCGMKLYR